MRARRGANSARVSWSGGAVLTPPISTAHWKPVPLVITNAQPFGKRLAYCSYGSTAGSGRTITLNVPKLHGTLLADNNTLLHEMVHQFLFERGEDVIAKQPVDKRAKIPLTIAQWWRLQYEDGEAVKEVLPERLGPTASLRDRLLPHCEGSFGFMLGAPCQLQSLAGQEHGRTIPLADVRTQSARELRAAYFVYFSRL